MLVVDGLSNVHHERGTGGALNLADVCVDRWAEETPNRTAILWEGEDGEVRQWTYEELQAEVDSLACMLAGRWKSKFSSRSATITSF